MEKQHSNSEGLVEKDRSIKHTNYQGENCSEVPESAREYNKEQRSSDNTLNDEMHIEANQINLLREKWKTDRTLAIRKRQTKKDLQSRRQIHAQELESDMVAFLNDLKDKVSIQGFSETSMQDLRKLKDILDFAIETPTQNIYQSYFEANAGGNSALMIHCSRSTQFLVIEFRNGNEQKQEEIFLFTQILSSLLIILEDREQECLQTIHTLVMTSNLMRDSLALCCISNTSRIKIQMMMLCSVFVRLSPEAALYVLSSGWINKIQGIVENSLLPGGFVLNSTVFFYHILKFLPLIDFPPEKASFCLKYLLTIMFDTLEKASVQLKVFDQLSDYVSLGLIKAKKIPLFKEVVMNEKIISKVLQLLDRFSCISSECCLEGLLRLLCSILKEIIKDQLQFVSQSQFIKQPQIIEVLLRFLNKNIAAAESDEAKKRCLQALIYLVELSPLVIDRLSQPLFIINIINSISTQSCRGEIIRVLHLLGAFGEDKIFREVMKETMIVSSLVKLFLIEDDIMPLKEKRALTGLLLVLLKIGETDNTNTDNYEDNQENFAILEISRCGGDAKLQQMLINESDNELCVNLELILDNYFRV